MMGAACGHRPSSRMHVPREMCFAKVSTERLWIDASVSRHVDGRGHFWLHSPTLAAARRLGNTGVALARAAQEIVNALSAGPYILARSFVTREPSISAT